MHVSSVTAVPFQYTSSASSPMPCLWSALTLFQLLARLRPLFQGSREGRRAFFPVEGSVAGPAGHWDIQESASAAGLGTGTWEDSEQRHTVHSAHLWDLLSCILLYFIGKKLFTRTASFFERPHSETVPTLNISHPGQTGYLLLCHIFEVQNMREGFCKFTVRTQTKC